MCGKAVNPLGDYRPNAVPGLQHEHSHYSYRGGWVGKRIMSRVAHKQDKQEIP